MPNFVPTPRQNQHDLVSREPIRKVPRSNVVETPTGTDG